MSLPAFWVNLVPQSSLACDDRGFNYGDGLFETMRYHQGELQLLEAHLQRLQRGCAALALEYPASDIQSQLDAARRYLKSHGIEQACLRLAVSRGSAARGYMPVEGQPCTLVCALYEATTPWGVLPAPVAAVHCRLRLASQPLLAGIKHSNRLEQVLASVEVARAGAQEGLLCGLAGEIVSAVSANVFAWDGACWVTPPITDCGVRGTRREFLLNRVGPLHNIPMREAAIGPDELNSCTAVVLCNSMIGLRALRSIDGRNLDPNREPRRLFDAFVQTMEGDCG